MFTVDPDHDDAAYLWDMLQASKSALSFAEGRTFEHYLREKLLRSAVERQVEIIGEAAGKISAETKASCPDIPWQRIVSQRNVLAHDYGRIQHEKIWHVATTLIPELIERLKIITPAPPADYLDDETPD